MFTIAMSSHGQQCIELVGGEEWQHVFLRRCVMDNRTDSPAYKAKQSAMPFLQGQCDARWTLVEFWGRNVEEYVAWLNDQITENTEYYQQFCETQS